MADARLRARLVGPDRPQGQLAAGNWRCWVKRKLGSGRDNDQQAEAF
ncbi:hypothetical protein ATKI12_5450 [Kitasatospora sp. Ki12]